MTRRPPLALWCLALLAAAVAPAAAQTAAPPRAAPATRPAAADYSNHQERWLTPPKVTDKRLVHRSYHSAAMDVRVGYHLYLPPGYDDPANAHRRYPVIYWLHGLNQSESSNWFPPGVLDDAVRGGVIPPVIMILASGGGRSFYCDAPDRKILPETTIIRELVPHVDATYRTVAKRQGRAIQGVSMGGFGALRLAMTYPELFSSVVGYMPSLRHPENLKETYPDVVDRMFGGDPQRFWAQHPLKLARERADTIRETLPIAFYCGDADKLLPGNRELHALLTELKIEHTYAEVPRAEHNLTQLVDHLKADGLIFAAKHFAADGGK